MPSHTISLLPFLLLWLLASFTTASVRTRGSTDGVSFFQKMNRLNYHYYLHDDSSYSHKMKEILIVRLGLAHYWNDVKGIRKPSQLPGLTLSVNRTAIGGPNDGLILPAISISYEIAMDLVDEHILDQLLPAMFWDEGWCGEDEVVGVWASIPKKNVENRMATIRIDLAQSKDSALFANILIDVSEFLGQLTTEEYDLKVQIIHPKKEHPLQGFRTLGSHEHSDWILVARDSHILADIDLREPDAAASAIRIIHADSAAGNLILTKRKYWPFDIEAYPLRIQVATVHPAIQYSLCEQILGIGTLEEDYVLALGFEKVDNHLYLMLWLQTTISKHTAEKLIEFERMLLLRFQLHLTMEFLDNQTAFRSANEPRYDPGARYPYKLIVMNKLYEHAHLIKTSEDFIALKHSPDSPTGYLQTTLERSRLIFFNSASPQILRTSPEVLALICTTSSRNLDALLKGLDLLVSRVNAVFYALKMPPSQILIEPMQAIAEEYSGKDKRSRQNRAGKPQGSEILSRFHFMLPSLLKNSQMQGDSSSLSLLWRLVHQFIRSCGIREKVELITLDAFRLEEVKKHAAVEFTQELERSTEILSKAVTGPSNSDINRARTARKPVQMTSSQLRERARKRELEKEAALKAEILLIQAEIERQKREKDEREAEMARSEQIRIENEAREAEETKQLAQEQEAKRVERQQAMAAEAKRQKEAVAASKAREKLSIASRPAYVEPKVYQKKTRVKRDPPPRAPIIPQAPTIPAVEVQQVDATVPASIINEEQSTPEHEAQSEVPQQPRRQIKAVFFTPLQSLILPRSERRRISIDTLTELY